MPLVYRCLRRVGGQCGAPTANYMADGIKSARRIHKSRNKNYGKYMAAEPGNMRKHLGLHRKFIPASINLLCRLRRLPRGYARPKS